MSTPLVTRALPNSPWERAPEWLRTIDESSQAWIASHLDMGRAPWIQLRWLTDSREGIGAFVITLGIMIALALRDRARRERYRSVLPKLLALLPLILLSDAASVWLKEYFGRLKPHVNFYNPNFLPALSLPSSHAFNLAFLVALAVFGLNRQEKRDLRGILLVIFTMAFLVSLTRVLFGQHYPLDVLVGWILGFALGTFFVGFIRQAKRFVDSRRPGRRSASL